MRLLLSSSNLPVSLAPAAVPASPPPAAPAAAASETATPAAHAPAVPAVVGLELLLMPAGCYGCGLSLAEGMQLVLLLHAVPVLLLVQLLVLPQAAESGLPSLLLVAVVD